MEKKQTKCLIVSLTHRNVNLATTAGRFLERQAKVDWQIKSTILSNYTFTKEKVTGRMEEDWSQHLQFFVQLIAHQFRTMRRLPMRLLVTVIAVSGFVPRQHWHLCHIELCVHPTPQSPFEDPRQFRYVCSRFVLVVARYLLKGPETVGNEQQCCH